MDIPETELGLATKRVRIEIQEYLVLFMQLKIASSRTYGSLSLRPDG